MQEESKLLGKEIAYPEAYCPEILVAVPRRLNREIYGIDRPDSLFCGYDSWHCYEASFLTKQGLPVAGILKLVYASTSEFLVESKSLKLYLGSFNMICLGDSVAEGIAVFKATVARDLSALLHTSVETAFFQTLPDSRPFDFPEYTLLETLPRIAAASFSAYQENPAYLSENVTKYGGEMLVCSHLLKSNCKITHQPDWGSIYIRIKAAHLPDELSLLKYIVSLRDENHFHEEICEMTFKRLTDIFNPEILMVCCLYTRRGGIDICPVRANKAEFIPTCLPRADILTASAFRQ